MKRVKKFCCGALIAGVLMTQVAVGGAYTSEATSGVWKENKKGWYYEYSDGSYAKSEWLKIGGKWYYFNARGYMVKNWQKIGKKWYYFGTDGKMRSGWQKINGKWYYFASGAMKTGWLKSGGKWFFFNTDGSMVTGTKTIGGKTYSFGSDGTMQDGSSDSSSFTNVKVGDIITFGQYEQDENTSNGKEPIEWLVLDKRSDGSFLVVSKYALEGQKYNTENEDVTWEKCTLRKWLNNTFLNSAFSANEKAKIANVMVKNGDNPDPDYRTKGGNDTKDQVFLLSIEEAEKYFKKDEEEMVNSSRACKGTAYAVYGDYSGNVWWWLRSPGAYQAAGAGVFASGGIDVGGIDVICDAFVRPALIINP